MSRASGGPDTSQRNRKNIADLLRAMPVICKRWKDLHLNDDENEVGGIWNINIM